MVIHEAVRVADPIIAFIDLLKGIQKVDPVLVALEDRLLLQYKRFSPQLLPIEGEEFEGEGDLGAAEKNSDILTCD